MNAGQFMGNFSAAGRVEQAPVVERKKRVTVIERWNGKQWVETRVERDEPEATK